LDKTTHYDVRKVRERFPGLNRLKNGRAAAFLDNPAGTQVPLEVVERMSDALLYRNANLDGDFDTSLEAGELVDAAHRAGKVFVNAPQSGEVFFGQSMTALTFAMSRAMTPLFKSGDEIVVSRMDHDGNVAPWLMLAEDLGLTVKWLEFSPETFEFDLNDLAALMTDRTRLVAVGYASNVTGTVHNIAGIARIAHAAGALVYVDAVQYAPHGLIDVQALGCDFLVCSAYKFFGPHYALFWGRTELLDRMRAYKVRPADDTLPWRFTNGTTNREELAGIHAAIDYIGSLGVEFGGVGQSAGLRERLAGGYRVMRRHDDGLALRLINGLRSYNSVRILGISDPQAFERRISTVSFVAEGTASDAISKNLAAQGVQVWAGHNYGIEPYRRLGLLDRGSGVRVGPVHYNTLEEIDRTVALVGEAIAAAANA